MSVMFAGVAKSRIDSKECSGWAYVHWLELFQSRRIQIKSNQIKFSHTYNKQYVHFIKSDVTEEIL